MPFMRICIFLCCLSVFGAELRRLDGSRIRVDEAEAFARKTLSEAKVTGAQIAMVDRGKLVWSFAYGERSVSPSMPMTVETTTWAASITKGFFGVYLMQLVERGVIALDIPIAKQLPRPLETYESYRETAAELVLDPAWLTITPRMMANHSSGLKNFPFLEPDKKMHLHFKPGSQYSYSGEGLNIVQLLIEQKLGKPLSELMQEAFFDRLGMKRTGLIYRKEFEANVADRFNEKGGFIAKTKRFPARAAGSMTSSAEDVAHFAEALLGDQLLKSATKKEMFRPTLAIRTLHQFPLAANEPDGEEAKAIGLAYGVGWGLLTTTKFGPAFFKEGHGDGAQNFMICFERRKACMVILTNSDNGELAFRPLLEKILGNAVTPWEWHAFTPGAIAAGRANQ